MKFDQLFILVLCALVIVALGKILADAFDVIEWDYDPATGRQRIKAQKTGLLADPVPLILEGQ